MRSLEMMLNLRRWVVAAAWAVAATASAQPNQDWAVIEGDCQTPSGNIDIYSSEPFFASAGLPPPLPPPVYIPSLPPPIMGAPPSILPPYLGFQADADVRQVDVLARVSTLRPARDTASCQVRAIYYTRMRVDPGTSGLAPGTPVVLRMSAATAVKTRHNHPLREPIWNSFFTSKLLVSAGFKATTLDRTLCLTNDSLCDPPLRASSFLYLRKQWEGNDEVFFPDGGPHGGHQPATIQVNTQREWVARGNISGVKTGNTTLEKSYAWCDPCLVDSPEISTDISENDPIQTPVVEFAAKVGETFAIEGSLYVEPQLDASQGSSSFLAPRTLSLSAMDGVQVSIEPAPGYEGLQLTYGNPDVTPPRVRVYANPDVPWTNAPGVDLVLLAMDEQGGSGVKSLAYSISGSEPFYDTDGFVQLRFGVEGEWTIHWEARDKRGNVTQGTKTIGIDWGAPQLNVPSTVEASVGSPAGGVVTYEVSATDALDPAPAIQCTPASGDSFPVGTTLVSCDATDHAGNTSSASFNVVVKLEPLAVVAGLSTTVASMGVPDGLRTALLAKLEATRSMLAAGNPAAACETATAFSHQVSAQTGKKLTREQAAALLEGVGVLKDATGCE